MRVLFSLIVIIVCIAGLIASCSKTTDDSTLPGFRVTYNGQRYVADSVWYQMVGSSLRMYTFTGGQKRFEVDILGQTASTYYLGTNNTIYCFDNGKSYSTDGVAGSGSFVITKYTDSINRYAGTRYSDSTKYISGNCGFTARTSTDSITFSSGYFNLVPVR